MTTVRRFLLRLLALFRSGHAEAELAHEVESHLRLLEDEFVARGMDADEARYAARRAFGGVEQVKERQRDTRAFRSLAGWPTDLRLGVRMLARSPGLTVVAVLALSIAIGGGVAYLEIVNDLFRPTLPVEGGERIVGVQNRDVATGRPEQRSLRDFVLWRASVTSIEHLGAHVPLERNLITEDGRSDLVRGAEISASAFRLIPTPPLLGRVLTAEDERPGAPPSVVIGFQLWQTRFNADPLIVGRAIRLGGVAHTVVGVMPRGFGFPVNQGLWVPLRVDGPNSSSAEGPSIRVFGRLAPGMRIESAQAELDAIAKRAAAESQGSSPHLRPEVRPYLESLRSDEPDRRVEEMILYSVNLFFVGLLGVCGANVAALVFARTATREGEIAVRTALGATRGRIVAQLFAEALVLASVAALIGVTAASIGVRWLVTWVSAQGIQPPFWWNDRLAPETLLYAGFLTLTAAMIIGVVPAMKATGREMQARLKHAAASGGSGLRFGGIWTGVIVSQVALTVICLLSVVSLAWNAAGGMKTSTAFGFRPGNFVVAAIDIDRPATSPASDDEFRRQFIAKYRLVEKRLEEDPGVAGVTYATHLPGGGHSEFWVELDGLSPATAPTHGPLWVRSGSVAADFFETFNAPIVRGRAFTPGDAEADRPVAIVDETFARLIFGARDPIGQRIRQAENGAHPRPGPWLEIVGVVKDVGAAPGKTTEDAMLYRPTAPGRSAPIHLAVHLKRDASAWTDRIRDRIAHMDPTIRLSGVMTLENLHRSDRVAHSMLARALAVVSGIALLLSTAGVHSLMSFTLARRRREIGIRVALGAAPRRIVTDIFSRAFRQVGLGVLAGSVPGAALVAMGAPEVASGGGTPVAAVATAAVAALIVAIAMFACVVPARRALRIDPAKALRAE